MKIKKIGVTTGEPFADTGCIVLKGDTSFYNMYTKGGYWSSQASSYEKGLRQASLEEIKSNWSAIQDQWDPQTGDLVRITQLGFNHENDYVINELYKGTPGYWRVNYLDGSPHNSFNKNQMVLSPNHGWEANSTPESVIDKKVEFTIKDGVLRFDGHEVRVGDIVSYDCGYIKKGFQKVTKIERDGYSANYPFVVESNWDNINNISNFVNHGQPKCKEPFKQLLKFKIDEKVLFITFNKGESGTIIKVNEEAEYFKYYVRLSSNNNICFCGEKDIISYSREEERALTIDEHLDSLRKFYSSGLIVEDSEIKLTIPLIKKSVSDYQQKPVTLYKPKTKLSLKPIKL